MKSLLRWKLLYDYLRQKSHFASVLALQRCHAGEISPKDVWSTTMKNMLTEKMSCFHLNKGFEMVPTISAQETLVVRKLPYSRCRKLPQQICVGDVVVLKDPLDPDNLVVRRLAAVGGYEMVSDNKEDEPFVLEDDQCWIVADNKNLKPGERNDSRTYGPISITNIIGRVMYRFRTLDHHGFVVNSPVSMQNDMPVFYVELDSNEMMKHNERETKDSQT
ncbi:Mitochondrial inner membrane protease subunit 1 [Bienertia sinuspersici]